MERPKVKVLAVDDDQSILDLLHVSLEMEDGYDVETASSGPAALDIAERFRPDIVLLDIMMPQVNGWQVAEQLRADPLLNHARIVFLTALTSQEDRQRAADLGVDGYVTKPFDLTELLQLTSGLASRLNPPAAV